MSEILNEWTGETLFDPTLFAAATPVSPSATPVNAKVKKTRGTSGPGYEKPYAFFDPVTQSLRMYEATCPLADLPSLTRLPPSGTTQNGVLFQRPPWEPITDATESSLLHIPTAKMNQMAPSMKSGWWPTPTAVTRPMEGNVRLYRAKIEAGEMTEEEATAILGKSPFEAQGKIPAMWPTPTSRDYKSGEAPRIRHGRIQTDTLGRAVQIWPTPRAGSMCGGTGAAEKIEERDSDGTISAEERPAMRAGNGGKIGRAHV